MNAVVEEARTIAGPVWLEPVGPMPVMAALRRPRVLVAIHRVLVPVDWRIWPRVPALAAVSLKTPVSVRLVAVVVPKVLVPVRVVRPEIDRAGALNVVPSNVKVDEVANVFAALV